MADHKGIHVQRMVRTYFFNLLNGAGDEKGTMCKQDPFLADEVIVRGVVVSGVASPGKVTYVRCPEIPGDGVLCTFGGAAESSLSPNTTFSVGKRVGNLTFGFFEREAIGKSSKDTEAPTTLVAQVAITLEFRHFS